MSLKDICSNCGTSYKEIMRTGFVGCEECYRSIQPLTENVRELFDGKMHSGRSPK